jgi:glycosyltransferase domain-containing protein
MTPVEIELLSELTIVIPTYNRPLELERAIEYWRDIPVQIFFIDGSEKPWLPIGVLPSAPNISYLHVPSKTDQPWFENLSHRFILGSCLPSTKYSAMGAADDFYTLSGLIESLKILESQPKLNAVAGRVLTYERKRSIVWHHKYVARFNRTDLEVDSIEKKLATRSSWFLYAVCRTEIWQKFLKTCYEEMNFTKANFSAHEWMLSILSKAMFRTRYLDAIQQVRQDTIIGWSKGPEVPWDEFICDVRNFCHIDDITKQLAKGFNEVTPESEHAKNLELAREQMRLEKEKALGSKTTQQKSRTFKSVLGNILFFFLPSLNIFSDRPRRLKYLWRIPKYQYSAQQQKEVEEIEKLLLKPREELRLRANI